ncbi:MAG: apolipoprotein N-acyltransferase, partial [Actinobacteria bacterium]|nr:apolipoprotein N-acyltransferase [Actinomycetota bacterium]
MVIARKVLLSGVSGILLFTSFAPIDFWPGAFLGTALLYGLIKDEVLLRRSVLSFISGALFFLPLLHWSSTYVGALPWLILALGEA